MSEIVLTPEQKAVVENRGGALLVSAAAGSGKTKVLVDRLLAQVCDTDDPANIDEFLIITYTKAAAAELRGKILSQLGARLAAQPENRHLQRQMTRIYMAPISTVHAYCAALLREYAHLLDIPADFRVAEEQESAALRQTVLDELLEQAYKRLDEKPQMRALIDQFGYGRDDRRLSSLVLPIYDAVRCRVDPEAWMQACEQAYHWTEGTSAEQTVWGAYLMQRLQKTVAWTAADLQRAIDSMAADDVLQQKYVPVFAENLEAVRELSRKKTWDEIALAPLTSFGTLTAVREPQDPELKESVQETRKTALQALKDAQACFYADSETVMADLKRTAGPICGLLQLIREFDRQYTQEKRRRKLFDFSDLEHETIRLLTDRASGKQTAAALEIAQRYREILVDEYQDSNAVQECIFEALSKNGKNRFMVGDMKQSIYRFRLADPGIFLQKYENFESYEAAGEGQPRKILLNRNFRSRREILNAVNDVFSLVMNAESSEMDYGQDEALRHGLPFEDTPQPKVELHCMDLDIDAADGEQKAEKCQEEAAFVAHRIHRLLQDKTLISDGGQLRPVKPGDIVILMRSPGNIAGEYAAALSRFQIPCVSERAGDVLLTTEAEVLIAILQILDNPHQDIPLVTVMASHVFGFTPDEIAAARTVDRNCDLYACLLRCETGGEKLKAFVNWLAKMRRLAGQLPLQQLIGQILHTTALREIYASMDDGLRRSDNLDTLLEFAGNFEKTIGGGLSRFTHHVQQMYESGTPLTAGQTDEQPDAVRIMSIHKSKGLEFPVVVLADLSRRFNLQDNAAAILLDDELMIGGNVVDAANGSYYTGIAKTAISKKMTAQSIAEELRVLYVAMTRAREMLIMTHCAAHLTARLQKWNTVMSIPVRPEVSGSAGCLGDWLLMAALCRTEAGQLFAAAGPNKVSRVWPDTWSITLHSAQMLRKNHARATSAKLSENQQVADAEALARESVYVYPHMCAAQIPSKLTATQLKGRVQDYEAAEAAQTPMTPQMPLRSANFQSEHVLSGRERGNAAHLFMQFVRYEACCEESGVRQELERLVRERFLTPQQAQAVDPARIVRLFTSEFGTRILQAQSLQREFKFSILVQADRYYAEAAQEQVMLQGVVDCFWQEAEGLVIVDFKTDRITGNLREKADGYAPQLTAYAEALSRIYKLPVKAKYLYFFDCDTPVEI